MTILCAQLFWLAMATPTAPSLAQAKKSACFACTSQKRAYTSLVSYLFFPLPIMSKQDLIAAIADAAGITKRAAGDALQAIINLVIKNLKKGRGRITSMVIADFINLIKYYNGVLDATFNKLFYDSSRHCVYISSNMTPNLCFISNSTQRDPNQFSSQSLGYGFAK